MLPPMCQEWDLIFAILMSTGWSDGHSLDPSGAGEAHETDFSGLKHIQVYGNT